jgi:hypothetical protein
MTSGENEMEVKAENEHQYFSKTKESQEMFPFVFFDIVVGIACHNSEGISLYPAGTDGGTWRFVGCSV